MKQKLLITIMLFILIFPLHTFAKENPYIVNINLWQGKLEILKKGLVIESFPIASGKKDTPSPVGIYRVISKDTGWGGGFGSCWLGLNVPWGTYGIHGTNRPELIGRRVSGGCFRMKNRNVEKVFAIIPVGTPVVIDGPITGHKDINYRMLVNGSRGSMVMFVQNHLKAMGIYKGAVDGVFGNELEKAVATYQKLKNFEVTKQIGLKELKDLDMIE
ncbi:MAG TPA: hypothetical protein DDY49_01420 [Paenibacillaceae bacterium]|nr:hypothetical protein [Paenibacillaceae bacterium]